MLPVDRPLSNFDIMDFVKTSKLKYFRGVFMRNKLPKKARKIECGVINLDNFEGDGTHWVSYFKNKMSTIYFDSFGNLQPPKEFITYIGSKSKILYNHTQYQSYNTFNCGHLCLKFLYNYSKKIK